MHYAFEGEILILLQSSISNTNSFVLMRFFNVNEIGDGVCPYFEVGVCLHFG